MIMASLLKRGVSEKTSNDINLQRVRTTMAMNDIIRLMLTNIFIWSVERIQARNLYDLEIIQALSRLHELLAKKRAIADSSTYN